MFVKSTLSVIVTSLSLIVAASVANAQQRLINPNPNPGMGRKMLGVYTQPVQLPGGGNGGGPVILVNPNPGGGRGGQPCRHGLKVTQVVPYSPAKRCGLEFGDIIVMAGNTQTPNENALRNAINTSGRYMTLQVLNVRNGQVVPVNVDFGGGGGGIAPPPGGGGGVTPVPTPAPAPRPVVYKMTVNQVVFKPTTKHDSILDGGDEYTVRWAIFKGEQRFEGNDIRDSESFSDVYANDSKIVTIRPMTLENIRPQDMMYFDHHAVETQGGVGIDAHTLDQADKKTLQAALLVGRNKTLEFNSDDFELTIYYDMVRQ